MPFMGFPFGGPLGAVAVVADAAAAKMGWTTASELVKYAQPADLIEFDRGVYKHWAMYLGDGWIINVPAESKNDTEVTISRERLVNVAGNSKVRVNNQEALATKYGYTKRSKTTAIQAATQDIGKTFPYSFMGKNCEFYSTKWLYGNGFSTQVGHYISEVKKAFTGPRDPLLGISAAMNEVKELQEANRLTHS